MADDTDNPPNIQIPAKSYGFPPEAFDPRRLPDYDTNFLPAHDLDAFIQALAAPDFVQSPDDASSMRLNSPGLHSPSSLDITKDDYDHSEARAALASVADVAAPGGGSNNHHRRTSTGTFFSAHNDWAPVSEKVIKTDRDEKRNKRGKDRKNKKPRKGVAPLRTLVGTRSKDETREGYLYSLLKWPFLLFVSFWIVGLGMAYLATRFYIYFYEQFVAWRGRREQLRRAMRATGNYKDWVAAARNMDDFFGNQRWKEENDFAYYDSKTVRRVWDQMRRCREKAEEVERELESESQNSDNGVASGEETSNTKAGGGNNGNDKKTQPVVDLKALIEACVKNNFVGIENPRLYSQTYYGTKNLVQNYVDEVERSIKFLIDTKQLTKEQKRVMFKGICANYGRTALCLSGGATFAYYHFGVVKALLEVDYLPDIITGTSGGALVAALVATRTNDELKELLNPALAHKITACREPFTVWFWRWWKTGARFDSVDWAKQCAWWCHGSLTFREAYERTGRILNVSCVPSDPHSPTILCNYLTSPDCVIWSAVLASAAVPGILNPVVLMMKNRDGSLEPYSFGHKWKDGSLRTDIPIKSLNLHFNVNFSIVSQVNPHINLFFFSSRGSVGQPVTHRKGRGWRGGYLGSATEQYIKLDLTKWLRVLRQLELLPRPLGQDWSQLWLQTFGGTVTIWPKSIPSDFLKILSDPDPPRLARMIHEGQQSAFPKVKFIANRLKIERLVERGRRETRDRRNAANVFTATGNGEGSYASHSIVDAMGGKHPLAPSSSGGAGDRRGSIESFLSEDDLRSLLIKGPEGVHTSWGSSTGTEDELTMTELEGEDDGGTSRVSEGGSRNRYFEGALEEDDGALEVAASDHSRS
ncbi:patatin-like phospholipase domain-containing protein NCU11180 [Neurospora crassa]|nr:patatin-like phospholipase domain-containing protein NCU11180 [Neurospora crassa]